MANHGIRELNTGLTESCPYYLGEGILDAFPQFLAPYEHDRLFLITSPSLFLRFGRDFSLMLDDNGIPHTLLTIQEGEMHKSWQTLSDLCERLVATRATRRSILVALGGGVIGNVVGMAAGLTYRGLRYIEVPTTLMAQTDGTLSNKQAINGNGGKNQFGLYHAPLFVWSDIAYVRREPVRQIKSAIVEGIKNGLVDDPAWLERLAEILRHGIERVHLEEFTFELIRSKLAILAKDPTEKRHAIVLEYGHTFGHAIEWLSRGELHHGEAVSIGMCVAARLSCQLGIASREVLEQHRYLLGELLDTPVDVPPSLAPRSIYQATLADNKRTGEGLRCLLLQSPGTLYNPGGDYLVPVTQEQALSALARSRA